MKKQSVSPNAAHASTIAVLAAAVEVGAEAILQSLGTDEASSEVDNQTLSTRDIQVALAARLTKKLGV